jgi:hypothetical protein
MQLGHRRAQAAGCRNGPRGQDGRPGRSGRGGRAAQEGGATNGPGGSVVWAFLYLFIHFSFLVFYLFCFYFLRFNFKLEHKLTNEKNSQQANSSIKRNMYSSVMQQSKLP